MDILKQIIKSCKVPEGVKIEIDIEAMPDITIEEFCEAIIKASKESKAKEVAA